MKTLFAVSILMMTLPAFAQHGDPGGRGGKGIVATEAPVVLKTDGQIAGKLDQANRLKVVFVAEGYSKKNKQEFLRQAQAKWDYMAGSSASKEPGVAPLNTYRNYFIPVALFAESAQDGACHPEKGDTCVSERPTAFEASYGTYGVNRLLTMNKSGTEKLEATLRAQVPDYNYAVVLVNDPTFGGSGGRFTIASAHPEATETLIHEFVGHGIGRVGDEFADPYPSFPGIEEPNTSTNPDISSPNHKWYRHSSAFLGNLPAGVPQEDVITQVFEGSHYNSTGWYRPFRTCKMRHAAKDEKFCVICREAIARAIYAKLNPIDGATTFPAATGGNMIKVAAGSPWRIEVKTLKPVASDTSPASMQVQWLIGRSSCDDATPIVGATDGSLSNTHPAMRHLTAGKYRICVKARDTQVDVVPVPGEPNPLEREQGWDLTIR